MRNIEYFLAVSLIAALFLVGCNTDDAKHSASPTATTRPTPIATPMLTPNVTTSPTSEATVMPELIPSDDILPSATDITTGDTNMTTPPAASEITGK
ncbi:MAG: hypothetical protein J6D00_03720 [Christensenellaceae bacterium]|nr:hypothetical protein [Christensenellaceae bacterium]